MTTIAHGDSVVISGSGFGSKSATAQLWDDCSGSDPLTLWSVARPFTASAASNMDYRTKAGLGLGIDPPHSHISQYLCGSHGEGSDANNGASVYVASDFTKPAFPYYSYWHYYARLNPAWTIDSIPSNNHKIYGYSTGNGSIYNLPNNWYLEFRSPDFVDSSSDVGWHANDDSSGTGLSIGSNFGNNQVNPTLGWVKTEICMKWQSDTTGFIKVWVDNAVIFNDTGKTDGYSGTTRCEGIGGYENSRNSSNWRLFNDIAYLRGDHIGRMMLTNNATYASSTIMEYQKYTSWADTSVTVTVNAGRLSNGTVHLHYRDEVNGNQYLGSYTLADVGGGGDTPSHRIQVVQGGLRW